MSDRSQESVDGNVWGGGSSVNVLVSKHRIAKKDSKNK